MTEHTQEHLDKIMDRVRKMLARADHPNTPEPEAVLCRERAEKLMMQYRIEEEALIAEGGAVSDLITPVSKRINVYPRGSKYSSVYTHLITYAMHHCGVKGVWVGYDTDDQGITSRVLEVFGYEIDLRYMEVLFTNARIIFADRMEPRYDPSLSDDENVYRLRSAGIERIKVAAMMGWGEEGTGKGAGGRVTSAYKRACAARGEEPVLTGQGMQLEDYRQLYTESFGNEFWSRLYNARNAVDADIKEGGLVLANREERVDEAMYQRYPELRPEPVDESATPAVWKDERTPAQVARDERRALRDQARRNSKRYSAAGRAGAQAGTAAAREIKIDGQTPTKRLGE
jgi:hypothetical protein